MCLDRPLVQPVTSTLIRLRRTEDSPREHETASPILVGSSLLSHTRADLVYPPPGGRHDGFSPRHSLAALLFRLALAAAAAAIAIGRTRITFRCARTPRIGSAIIVVAVDERVTVVVDTVSTKPLSLVGGEPQSSEQLHTVSLGGTQIVSPHWGGEPQSTAQLKLSSMPSQTVSPQQYIAAGVSVHCHLPWVQRESLHETGASPSPSPQQ